MIRGRMLVMSSAVLVLLGACESGERFTTERHGPVFDGEVDPSGSSVAVVADDLLIVDPVGGVAVVPTIGRPVSVAWIDDDRLVVSTKPAGDVFAATELTIVDRAGTVISQVDIADDVAFAMGIDLFDSESLVVSVSPAELGGGDSLAWVSLRDGQVTPIDGTAGLIYPVVFGSSLFAEDRDANRIIRVDEGGVADAGWAIGLDVRHFEMFGDMLVMSAACADTLENAGVWLQIVDEDLGPADEPRFLRGQVSSMPFALAGGALLFKSVGQPSSPTDLWRHYSAAELTELPAVEEVCGR